MADINVKNLKKFRGGIRLDTSRAETELLGTDAEAEGTLIYDKNTKGLKIRNEGGFAAVGGGSGGGLDTFYTEDFTTIASNRFYDDGGMDSEFDSTLSDRTLKFTYGTGENAQVRVSGPYGCYQKEILVPGTRQKGQTCSVSFWYKTSGSFVEGDIKFWLRQDVSDSTDIILETLPAAPNIKKFVATFTMPSAATQLEWGMYNTREVTTAAPIYIHIDDMEMSQDPFVQIDLLESVASLPTLSDEVACISKKDGDYTIGTSSETTISANTKTIIPWTAPHKDTHSKFDTTNSVYIIPEDGIYHIDVSVTYRSNASDDDARLIMELNSVAYGNFASRGKYTTSYYDSSSTYQTAKLTFSEEYAKDDELRFYWYGSDTNYLQGHDEKSYFSIYKAPQKIAAAPIPVTTNSHIVTPAKSNLTNWESYTPTGSWDYTTFQGQWRRVGDSMELSLVAKCTGTVSGTNDPFTITIPSGYTIDTNKLNNALDSTQENSGYAFIHDSDSAGDRRSGKVFPHNSTTLQVIGDGMGGVHGDAPFTWVSGDHLTLFATVPITGWGAQDSNFLAALPMTKWKTKRSSGTHTGGEISDFNFDNLDGTKTYRISGAMYLKEQSTTSNVIQFYINKDGHPTEVANQIRKFTFGPSTDSNPAYGEANLSFNVIWKAEGFTKLRFTGVNLGSGKEINLDAEYTWVTVEELPMHEEVDIW